MLWRKFAFDLQSSCHSAFALQLCGEALLYQSAMLLQKAAEAHVYMQYVAFGSAVHRYVPVLLTDGNVMVLYVHNKKLKAHQRMHWDFDQIVDASIFLEELVKHIALENPLMRGYIIGQDHQPDFSEDPGTEHGGPGTEHGGSGSDHVEFSMDHDECEQNDQDTPSTSAEQHHGSSRTATSMPLGQQYSLTEMQDADMQEALRLARFHPCVTAVLGLPPYAKPNFYGLAS
jgi:hypothetical protein